jgi:hypothetical protein
MKPASFWRTWPGVKPVLGAAFALYLLPAVLAQGNPQVQFVKILAGNSGGYGPPSHFAAGETIGVKISSFSWPEAAELRVYGLVNHSAGRPYEKNETAALAVLRGADVRKQNVAKDASELVVPLSTVDTRDALEITASLVDAKGVQVGNPAKLTLDLSASTQAGPSILQKAVSTGSGLLGRLMNIYEDVRDAPDPRFVFSVTLEHGKPPSAPVRLPLDRAQFRALAISPQGKQMAWVVEEPGQFTLSLSEIERISPVKIASTTEEIVSPFFADERLLLYVTNSRLVLAATDKPGGPAALALSFRAVRRIESAAMKEGHIECIVAAAHRSTPALDLPYMVKISVPDGKAEVFRLPVNPYYKSYPLLVAGSPFFFAGSESGVEGIQYFQLDDPDGQIRTFYKVPFPGLVALAANGSRLLFAGGP